MKALVVLMFLGLTTLSYQEDSSSFNMEEFKAKRDACIKETNAKPDDVTKAWKEGVYADDKNFKCYFKCMGQKTGVMNDAGVLNIDFIKSHIPSWVDKTKAEAAVEKCKSSKVSDPCEIAFEFTKCFHQELGPLHRPTPAPGK